MSLTKRSTTFMVLLMAGSWILFAQRRSPYANLPTRRSTHPTATPSPTPTPVIRPVLPVPRPDPVREQLAIIESQDTDLARKGEAVAAAARLGLPAMQPAIDMLQRAIRQAKPLLSQAVELRQSGASDEESARAASAVENNSMVISAGIMILGAVGDRRAIAVLENLPFEEFGSPMGENVRSLSADALASINKRFPPTAAAAATGTPAARPAPARGPVPPVSAAAIAGGEDPRSREIRSLIQTLMDDEAHKQAKSVVDRLVAIGAPAVDPLLRMLEASLRRHQPLMDRHKALMAAGAPEADAAGRAYRSNFVNIGLCILALGDIGDQRALPALAALRPTTVGQALDKQIGQAVSTIHAGGRRATPQHASGPSAELDSLTTELRAEETPLERRREVIRRFIEIGRPAVPTVLAALARTRQVDHEFRSSPILMGALDPAFAVWDKVGEYDEFGFGGPIRVEEYRVTGGQGAARARQILLHFAAVSAACAYILGEIGDPQALGPLAELEKEIGRQTSIVRAAMARIRKQNPG